MKNRYPEFVVDIFNKVMLRLNKRRMNDQRIKLLDKAFHWDTSYRKYYNLIFFSKNDFFY